LLMSLKSLFILKSTLIWKEPMKRDHLSFNFDVHFAHQLFILLVIVMFMSKIVKSYVKVEKPKKM
jgi:hypothetical protein